MDRGYEAQLNRATALSLVLNAIVVWNTRYLTAAAEELGKREKLVVVTDEMWKHLSPILWEHVHLVGSYQFTEPKIEGEIRPLRSTSPSGKSKATVPPRDQTALDHQNPSQDENTTEATVHEAHSEETSTTTPPLIQLALLTEEEENEDLSPASIS